MNEEIEIEDIDSTTDEEEQEEEETVDALKSKNQSLYEQLQKAKGKIRGEDGKWAKKPEPIVVEDKPVVNKQDKSEGFDYGQKAFLVANGVKGEKENELVQKVMADTGRTIEQVLESKYFQADLTEMREIDTTKNATIEGKRAGNGAVNSIEYWASKSFEEVPKDMRTDVVNYKLKKESTAGGNFYNS